MLDSAHTGGAKRQFATTEWSLVLAAADSNRSDNREALAELCERYWYPIYAQIRYRQGDPDKARDLTQGFFAHIFEKHSLKIADRERGKFRAFLKTTLKHYLSNLRHRETAQKRGGGKTSLSLDFEGAEACYRLEPQETTTPENLFERHWARTMIWRVLDALRAEQQGNSGKRRLRMLEPLLVGQPAASSYRRMAVQLEVSESAVKVAVHRLRKRFGILLREEVARTVEGPDEIDAELRYLLSVLGSD
jgi:RNA polymerase sigma-70 factor (ECF subfamily)